MPRRRLTIATADAAALAAVVDEAADHRRWAVLCHPHPDMGGSMGIPVLSLIATTLAGAGVSTLRFDFRRPGTDDERAMDVLAAIDATGAGGDIAVVGWSYGADQALRAAADDERVTTAVAIAPTFRFSEPACARRAIERGVEVVALVPEHDDFTPPARARERFDGDRVVVIPGADHFLAGAEDAVAGLVSAHLAG